MPCHRPLPIPPENIRKRKVPMKHNKRQVIWNGLI